MNFADDLVNPIGRGVTNNNEHGHLIDDFENRVDRNSNFG